ncbi:MAG: TIGR03936 family radical SAM-associated protein [Propioniciclava sp.]
MRQQPPQQAAPVQRLDIRYAKRGRARFASHRDFSRAFERALRRARVPMAYSSGFNPHPRISYANACPTGAASEAEYLQIGLARAVVPDQLTPALTAALPDGFEVIAVTEAIPGGLATHLAASQWRVEAAGVPTAVAREAVARLLAAEVVEIERMTKSGLRRFDARAAVLHLAVDEAGGLDLVAEHTTPLVRPDDVVSALRTLAPAFDPQVPPVLTRLAQGRWEDGEVVGPFEARRGS